MEITLEQLQSAGYRLRAAPHDAWRNYDEHNPVPGYFEFDWLSARHPGLYHKFALSTVGLMNELDKLVDLTGLLVADIAAGTGRATIEAARKAKKVHAIDIYESVVSFGSELASLAGLGNVSYILGDSSNLPLPDSSVDASICAWALLNYPEAYRVLRPGGYLIKLGPAPGSLCGELTATLADVYPEAITEVAPDNQFDASCPESNSMTNDIEWNGALLAAPINVHDFTYVADYGDHREAAAILGRLYGPKAKRYMLDRQQSTLAYRLRISYSRVKK